MAGGCSRDDYVYFIVINTDVGMHERLENEGLWYADMAFMICMEREKTRESAELLSLESLFIESVDIVSFGILVLEIISGQKFVAFFISRVWKIYLAFVSSYFPLLFLHANKKVCIETCYI